MSGHELLRVALAGDQDVFRLRQCGRAVAEQVGLSSQDQIRVATALSDLGRVASAGTDVQAVFTLRADGFWLDIALTWRGSPADGHPSWETARRLMDDVGESSDGDVRTATLGKRLATAIPYDERRYSTLRARLVGQGAGSALDELRAQNEHLLSLLDELEKGKQELLRLNAEMDAANKGTMALYTELTEELDRTNQGVVALYAELEDKTEQLAAASEAKSRYWANVSHELRSPLNSVVGLTRLMLDPDADPLTDMQRRQVELIGTSGEAVLVMTNDLLDVAKAEAGRVEVRVGPIDLRVLFAHLRVTLQAAHDVAAVSLVVEDPPAGVLFSDESLLTRILRNAVTNALKFTERGVVCLTVRDSGGEWVFTVADTGIGIPEKHLDRVFDEFHQVPSQLQRGGIGLGLPYARTLARLLGGDLTLASEVGVGTTVTMRLPGESRAALVLVAEPDPVLRARLAALLAPLAEEVVSVDSANAAVALLADRTPSAVFLDPGNGVPAALSGLPLVLLTADPPGADRTTLARGELSAESVAAALRAAGGPR